MQREDQPVMTTELERIAAGARCEPKPGRLDHVWLLRFVEHRGGDPRLKGPKGEKRPADVIGGAVKVMRIATGEIAEDIDDGGRNKAAVELGRKGGKARAEKISAKRRKEIARKAAEGKLLQRGAIWVTSPWKPSYLGYTGL